MPSVTAALGDFANAVTKIGVQLLNSVLAVFTAIFALGSDIVGAFLSLGQSIVKLGLDIFQGVFGFVAANFILLAVLGGGYYLYTNRNNARTRVKTT